MGWLAFQEHFRGLDCEGPWLGWVRMPFIRGHPPPLLGWILAGPGRCSVARCISRCPMGWLGGGWGLASGGMAAPGWYPDPTRGPRGMRYWDGQVWVDAIPAPPKKPVGNGMVFLIVVAGVLLVLGVVALLTSALDRGAGGNLATSAPLTTRSQPSLSISPPLVQQEPIDRLFLRVLRENGIDYGSDDDAILKGQAVCVFLRKGTNQAEILEAVRGVPPPMSESDAAFLFGAAAQAYCPEVNPAGR